MTSCVSCSFCCCSVALAREKNTTLRCNSSIMSFLRRRESRAALRFCAKRTSRTLGVANATVVDCGPDGGDAPVADSAMFRKSRVTCLRVADWRVTGGSTPTGQSGYRHIAGCVTGAEGPGALIDMGIAADPAFKPAWTGGIVDGLITTEPSQTSLIGKLFGRTPPLRPMLVADVPAPGLAASAPPGVDGIANNHLAYAVQWFVFAGVALVIYVIALRRRMTL